jgi:hypothetical protein
MERTAQCHCGSLRVIASGEPERVYVCHCRACQRCTGAVVHSGCTYPKSQVRIEGDNKIYEPDENSGFKIRFYFCPNAAGSYVFWEGDRNPNTYGIAVGSFADPNFPPPTYSVWEEVMHPWLGLATVTGHFSQGRPFDQLTWRGENRTAPRGGGVLPNGELLLPACRAILLLNESRSTEKI